MSQFNREMAIDGAYPLDIYEEMIGYIAEYRAGGGEAGSGANRP